MPNGDVDFDQNGIDNFVQKGLKVESRGLQTGPIKF